ncbi:hypothetical protein RSAG8_09634, partial [Rhizoctonia solani AG-8 WAC10335]
MSSRKCSSCSPDMFMTRSRLLYLVLEITSIILNTVTRLCHLVSTSRSKPPIQMLLPLVTRLWLDVSSHPSFVLSWLPQQGCSLSEVRSTSVLIHPRLKHILFPGV